MPKTRVRSSGVGQPAQERRLGAPAEGTADADDRRDGVGGRHRVHLGQQRDARALHQQAAHEDGARTQAIDEDAGDGKHQQLHESDVGDDEAGDGGAQSAHLAEIDDQERQGEAASDRGQRVAEQHPADYRAHRPSTPFVRHSLRAAGSAIAASSDTVTEISPRVKSSPASRHTVT